MNNQKPIIHISEFTYTEIFDGMNIAVLPWGSCEPHGEYLSYCTDTLLAEKIAEDSIYKTDNPNMFRVLPSISFGSQNIGQYDKKFCIHFSIETQKGILRDIVASLNKQSVNKLVIINGHNGNNFKSIVRDLEFEFPDFRIYVCNYLDLVTHEWIIKNVNNLAPLIDDHAGFTETSLMLYYFNLLFNPKHYVNIAELGEYQFDKNETDIYNKVKSNSALWTPRDWDDYSFKTRIGSAKRASTNYGKIIAEYICEQIAKDLNKIVKLEL